MAGFLNWLIGRSEGAQEVIKVGGDLARSASKGIDKMVYTKQEKAEDAIKMQKHDDDVNADLDVEVTKRWQADSSAPVSRLVRPFLVIYMTFFLTIFGALDSLIESVQVSDAWLNLFAYAWGAMVVAYFGARTLDKRNAAKYGK